jgi:nitrogen regulatory protein P-II 1
LGRISVGGGIILKKIEAIIRPVKLDEIMAALTVAGILGITVSNVLGFSSQKGYTLNCRGREVNNYLISKVKLEILSTDEKVEEVIGIIDKTTRTGQNGDGRIFDQILDEVVSIRTSEQGEQAIRLAF